MSKKILEKYYQIALLDWMGSGFEIQKFETLEEAIKEARKVLLSSSPYAHLYGSVLIEHYKQISDHNYEFTEIMVVEKQPETWKIVEIEAKNFNEKSLYRWGDLEAYKKDVESRMEQHEQEQTQKEEAEL